MEVGDDEWNHCDICYANVELLFFLLKDKFLKVDFWNSMNSQNSQQNSRTLCLSISKLSGVSIAKLSWWNVHYFKDFTGKQGQHFWNLQFAFPKFTISSQINQSKRLYLAAEKGDLATVQSLLESLTIEEINRERFMWNQVYTCWH